MVQPVPEFMGDSYIRYEVLAEAEGARERIVESHNGGVFEVLTVEGYTWHRNSEGVRKTL